MASTLPVEKPSGSGSEVAEGGYTLESLKAHGSRESFWMLLHDKVYDVTAFLDEVGFDLPFVISHSAWGVEME